MTAPTLTREARLDWARGVLADREPHSPARLRRACQTIINHAPREAECERRDARRILEGLQP